MCALANTMALPGALPCPEDLLAGLNPAQQEAVLAPAQVALKILAGAGTGKTEVLARRYARLALTSEGRQTDPILVVTFTDKAAHSMRTRIRGWMPQLTEENAQWIGTFHQICRRILVPHAQRLGLPSTFEVLDAHGRRQLLQTLLKQVRRGQHADLAGPLARYGLLGQVSPDVLSAEALGAVSHHEVCPYLDALLPLLDRVQSTGSLPAAFLQAARQQTQAWHAQLQALPTAFAYSQGPFSSLEEAASTWHAALAPYAAPTWDVLQHACTADQRQEANDNAALKKALACFLEPGLWLTYNGRKKNPAQRLAPAQDPEAWARFEAAHQETMGWIDRTAAFYALYLHRLAEAGAVDFDGLIGQTVHLLETAPDLRTAYQQRFTALLVDEFQDSNPAQLALIRLLMQPEAPNLTVVGDEKQSIYGFRYAQRENLDLVFEGIVHQTLHLQHNYRSGPQILAPANRFTAQYLTPDPGQQLQCGRFSPPSFRDEATPAFIVQRFDAADAAPEDTDTDEDARGEPASMAQLRRREAAWLVDALHRLHETGVAWRDMAILSRNHAKAVQLEWALLQAGIPAWKQKHPGFLSEPVIKTATAVLNLLAVPGHTVSLWRLLQTRLPDAMLHRLAQAAQGHPSLWHCLLQLPAVPLPDVPASIQAALADLTTTLRYHHTLLADEPWLAVYEALVDALDAAPSPLTPWPAPRQQREAALYGDWLRCLAQLQDTLKNASQQPLNQAELLATVRSRLAELADLGDWSPELSEADREAMAALDAVQLLTIHGAKGLEFDVVFLAFVDSAWTSQAAGEYLQLEPQPAPKPGFGLSMTRYQGLPTAAHQVIEAIWRKPRQEAERQRLFYVALTRAKHRLYLLMSENLPGWVDTVATMGQAPPP